MKKIKKLELKVNVGRSLTEAELNDVAGGIRFTKVDPCSTGCATTANTGSCCTDPNVCGFAPADPVVPA